MSIERLTFLGRINFADCFLPAMPPPWRFITLEIPDALSEAVARSDQIFVGYDAAVWGPTGELVLRASAWSARAVPSVVGYGLEVDLTEVVEYHPDLFQSLVPRRREDFDPLDRRDRIVPRPTPTLLAITGSYRAFTSSSHPH